MPKLVPTNAAQIAEAIKTGQKVIRVASTDNHVITAIKAIKADNPKAEIDITLREGLTPKSLTRAVDKAAQNRRFQ